MTKVMNVIFGIGIAIILFSLTLLGFHAFYPSPEYDDFCERGQEILRLEQNITEEEITEQEECEGEFDNARDNWSRNIFIIAIITGIIVVSASLALLSMISISAGTAMAGIGTIIYGFIVGFDGTSDILRFIIGVVVTAIIITYAVIIHKKSK
jgi:hypothetical protein